jgi:hypothetical protein
MRTWRRSIDTASTSWASAKRACRVTLILLGDEPVGMFNLNAGYRVNFAGADPGLLLRPVDVAFVVFGGTRLDRGVDVHRPGHLRACRAVAGVLHPGLGCGTPEVTQCAAAPGRRLLDQMQVDHVVKPFRRRS